MELLLFIMYYISLTYFILNMEVIFLIFTAKYCLLVCVEVLRPSQPNGLGHVKRSQFT